MAIRRLRGAAEDHAGAARRDSYSRGPPRIEHPRHGESKQEIVRPIGKARGEQSAPPALLMNDTCGSIELSSASMPLLLEETILDDERMNRPINQVALRVRGSHDLSSLDCTWVNLDRCSRRRLRFDRLGRLRLCGLYVGRRSYLERNRYAELIR